MSELVFSGNHHGQADHGAPELGVGLSVRQSGLPSGAVQALLMA